MIERRKYVRIPESLPISYKIIPNKEIAHLITKDISQGGIRFLIYEFIPKDSILEIRLTFTKIHFSFEALVKLVWIVEDPRNERFEIGVKFINISKEAEGHLINYINNSLRFR